MPKIAIIRSLAFLAMLPLLAVGGRVLAAVATVESCAERQEGIAVSAACGTQGPIASAPDAGKEKRPAVSSEPNPKVQPQPPLHVTHPCGEDRPGVEQRPPSY